MADTLGAFEQAVLISILRLDDEAYGRAILRETEARLRREVAPGAIQATLERLESKGLVRSRLGPGTEIRAGRPRRYYRLQPAAVAALNDARSAFDHLWRGLRFPLKRFVKGTA